MAETLSVYRVFNRNYTAKELLGEIKNLIDSDDYEDFIFVAAGKRRSIRIGSKDNNLRKGDLLYLNKLIEQDIMEL